MRRRGGRGRRSPCRRARVRARASTSPAVYRSSCCVSCVARKGGHGAKRGPNPLSVYRLAVELADGRDQVVLKGAGEVVTRAEAPVAARGAVVGVLGPAIDDALSLDV